MTDKLSKPIVLYMDGKTIGNPAGARCGRCMMFVGESDSKNGHCTVVAGSISGSSGVCGLYVHGKHGGPDMHGMMPKEIAGYIGGAPTHCGSCKYYSGGQESGPCEKIAGTVEYTGCCNYWEPAARGLARLG